MLDFVSIKHKKSKGKIIVYPEFKAKRSKDLMIRGRSFYAVWNEEVGYWSTDEYDVQRMVDRMIYDYVESKPFDGSVELKLMVDFSSNSWTEWQKYCKSLADNYKELDVNVTFANGDKKKTDYVSHSLDYSLSAQETPAYEELISTLYDEPERRKMEWAIGSVIAGDSKRLQKFFVLYGAPGSGKSTYLNIVQMLFPGYYSVFDSKALTKVSNAFALEAFRTNPLVAIEHDGDLSRIEDNTKLNSIVSHEEMMVNEKFKSTYLSKFHSLLFMGTNKPVKITDAKSGILRRLIDVQPSGKRVTRKRFDELMDQIPYELGGIAAQCLGRYQELGYRYYDDYVPLSMMGATNDFFNFVEDNYDFFLEGSEEGISLSTAWKRYQEYCEDARVPYPLNKRLFKDEMKNYFKRFEERTGNRRSVFFGFQKEKLDYKPLDEYRKEVVEEESWLRLEDVSKFGGRCLLDDVLKDCPAQYASEEGVPTCKWENCKTKMSDLDSSKTHYVRPPEILIGIDFDLKDEKGEKNYELNRRAASKWPKTYAEVSNGGHGIHLHYWYEGDPSKLSRVSEQSNEIEIKVFTGLSSLRRRVSKCNDIPIATISSGLPLKEVKKVVKEETIKSERGLRQMIKKNLNKEIHPFTKPSIDFILKILDDAYASGLKYDVRDMRPAIQNFALSSSHNADYCLKCVSKMKFASEEASEDVGKYKDEAPIVFFDVEVFPNLFIVAWKKLGEGNKPIAWINPTPDMMEELCQNRLVGFNNRKYDNHMIYARMMGYTEEQLFKLSQRIVVEKDRDAFFGEAYNLSYTDIYDVSSPANMKGLKKWEIELGIHHHELGYRWDEPVPEEKWFEVADYCKDDVLATEAVWLTPEIKADFKTREILADWAGMTVNTPTNTLAAKIVFGNDKHPQNQFVYTDLSTIFPGYRFDRYGIPKEEYAEGAKIVTGKSIYRGEDPSEGGKVNAKPGIYRNVGVLDIVSQHPHSIKRLNVFGDKYTKNFVNIVDARKYIKHKQFDRAEEVLPEKVHHYLDDPSEAKALAGGLKGCINPVYGLTSAKFPNPFKDPRNEDNIVAKYGALFMIDLRHEVEDRGWEWVHIKTDSIKIADITPEIVDFVMKFGEKYGFEFEYETKYSKMCLVNESTYIAEVAEEGGEKVDPYWTATGAQFAVPYVFKTLFSKEPIVFDDLCETKSVSTAMYLDFNEGLSEEEHEYRFVGKVGRFCPMKDGCGAAWLLREGKDKEGNRKFDAVTGTKKPDGKSLYKWMEAEMVLKLGLQDQIDRSYYNHLVDKAVDEISKHGDFEQFVSDDVPDESWMNVPDGFEEEGLPFDICMNEPELA